MRKLLFIILICTLFGCDESRDEILDNEINSLKLIIDQNNISETKYHQIQQKLNELADKASHKPRYWVQKARFELGCGYFSIKCDKEGMWQRALLAINKAKELDQSDIEVLSLSGHVLRNLKRYDDAKLDLEKALSIDSSHAWSNLNYAALMADIALKMGLRLNDPNFMEKRYQVMVRGLDSLKVVLEGEYEQREQMAAISKCIEITRWMPLKDRMYCNKAKIDLDYFDNLKEKAWANGNYSLQLLIVERYEEARIYADNAVKLMNYPLARQALAASYIGLWIESKYEDKSLLAKAYEMYPYNKLDPVFLLESRMNDISFFMELKKSGVDLNSHDSKGETLLGKALIFHIDQKEKNFDRIKSLVEHLDLKVDLVYSKVLYPSRKRELTTPIEEVHNRVQRLDKEKNKPNFSDHIKLEFYSKLYHLFQQRLTDREI